MQLIDTKELALAEWEQLISFVCRFTSYSPVDLERLNIDRFLEVLNEAERQAKKQSK